MTTITREQANDATTKRDIAEATRAIDAIERRRGEKLDAALRTRAIATVAAGLAATRMAK
ncbi:MAG: hypothetical protein U1D55_00510 [Phycisphaerae bacterium]